MERLFERTVSKIFAACLVGRGGGTPVHKSRAYHGVVFYLEGKAHYHFEDGRTVSTGENDVLYLPKGSSYTVSSSPDGSCYCINFDFLEETEVTPFIMKMRNHTRVRELFKTAEQVWTRKSTGYECKTKSLIYDVLYEMCREHNNGYLSSKKAAVLEPALEQIHSHYFDGETDVPYLADLCGISQTYFRNTFQKRFGTSPVKYINRLKLTRARELIESGGYSVREAALSSGFSDESYFSREFKRAFGCSPVFVKKHPTQY